MKKLYENIANIENILKIESPELSSILNLKWEEARNKNVKFIWHLDIEEKNLPLAPEDITHLMGNLLDNAIEAAKSHCSPEVNLTLTSNKFGLRLLVSNNGDSINQNLKEKIFTPGFTTKDRKLHSGLGLYIIKQIIERYDGNLEMKEFGNYQGILFDIYIPWNK